jgi:hypothetical protein
VQLVLVERLNAGTVTALFIVYSDLAFLGNLERNLKFEETRAENEVVCGICFSHCHPSWIAPA